MDSVKITLSTQAYNVIVRALQEIPWKIANPVLQEIDPQVRAVLAKEQETRVSDVQDKVPA